MLIRKRQQTQKAEKDANQGKDGKKRKKRRRRKKKNGRKSFPNSGREKERVDSDAFSFMSVAVKKF